MNFSFVVELKKIIRLESLMSILKVLIYKYNIAKKKFTLSFESST